MYLGRLRDGKDDYLAPGIVHGSTLWQGSLVQTGGWDWVKKAVGVVYTYSEAPRKYKCLVTSRG